MKLRYIMIEKRIFKEKFKKIIILYNLKIMKLLTNLFNQNKIINNFKYTYRIKIIKIVLFKKDLMIIKLNNSKKIKFFNIYNLKYHNQMTMNNY